jgi:LmbE family N-acetylglucosaminyl deacetylase
MHHKKGSRRKFVKNALGGISVLSLSSLLSAKPVMAAQKKKVVVVGGHPDDPECGCAGTVVQLTKAGHDVTLMYLTNGDEGIEGKTHEEAAAIRRKECIAACKILNAKPLFVDQVDGESVMSNPEMAKFEKLLYAEKPDVVFTHWPIDSHKDHQVASILTIQSWMEAQRPFALYFYEVCVGYQTFGFHPSDYVDISDYQQIKMQALGCHKSQDIVGDDGRYTKSFYDCGHPSMEDFRGKELGVKGSEAFTRMNGRGMGKLVIGA